MLDGLEGADGPAELVAHLRVADGRGQHCLTEAEAVARDGDRGPPQPTNRGFGVSIEPQHLGRCATLNSGQPAGLVEDQVYGRLCYGDGTVGDHQDPVGALSVGHEVQRLERNGDPHGAGRHIGQKPVAGIAGLQRFQRADSQDGTAKIAVGAGGASHLLADDRDFGECGARSAELLGHSSRSNRRRREPTSRRCGPWPADHRLPT